MTTSDGPDDPRSDSGPPSSGAGRGRDQDRAWRRELGERLGDVQRQGERNQENLGRLARQVGDLVDEVSRMAPRVDDIEAGVASLGGALEAGGGDEGVDAAIALTPATRWSQLSISDKRAAWDALSGWVAAVLNAEYRLTRMQLPDCWPVHPRAVRELAWLRTLHVASTDPRIRPEIVAEWHTRWLPGAIQNISVAIDPRECAPGRHRLTEDERYDYEDALDAARERGELPPLLTEERGPDRPRYLPDRFPPRRTRDDGPTDHQARPRPRSLDEGTPPPASTPDDWREYFLDARLADVGQDLDRE